MDQLKAELEKKKKERELLKGNSQKKWIRQEDLEKEREKRYLEEEEKEAAEKKKKKKEEEKESLITEPKLTEKQITTIQTLRKYGQPIKLFGETDEEREKRCINIIKYGVPKEIVDLNSIQFEEEKKDIKTEVKSEKEKGEFELKEEFVLNMIKTILEMWRKKLDEMTDQEKKEFEAKQFIKQYNEAKDNLTPLIRRLEKNDTPLNILGSLYKIFKHVEAKEYLLANDTYLNLAIGNSPWINDTGATSIHERSTRERMDERHSKTQVLNEKQRKYIQSVKRLISFIEKNQQ